MTASDSVTGNHAARQSSAAPIGPGDRLQAARIGRGWSIEEVANRMYLSGSILQLIEENNFDKIAAPIFVKGYLRAYARILSLSEEDIIQQYVEYYSDEDPPITRISNTPPEISFNDVRVRWATYILILVLCCLLIVWWWSRDQQSDVVSLDIEQTEVVAAEPEMVNDIDPADESGKVDDPVENNSVPAEIEPSLPSPQEPQTVETEVEQSPETEVMPEASNTDQTNPAPADDSGIAPTDTDVMTLFFRADVWVSVEDANGNRLAYNMVQAGEQLTVTGQAPFAVLLGNGHDVEMTYNGAAVDISSYIRSNNTARLKVGNQ